MANATPRDSRAGFTIYRESGGGISRDALNDQLVSAGYGPVSDRTVTHYRSLLEAGFDRYISINRFDVARSASRFEDLGASPRYGFQTYGEGVRLMIAKGDQLWEAAAVVESVGETGVVLRFVDDEYAAGLEALKVRASDYVYLNFLETGRSETARVIEVDTTTRPPILEVQFAHLVSLAEISARPTLPTVRLEFRVHSDTDDALTTADQLGRRLYLLFELVDELRFIANEAARLAETEEYSAPPIVDRLSVASPIEVSLAVANIVGDLFPFGLITVALRLLWQVPEKRKTWLEGTGQAIANRASESAAQRAEAEAARAAAERDIAVQIRNVIVARYNPPEHVAAQLESIALDRLPPLLEALVQAGVESIEPVGESQIPAE